MPENAFSSSPMQNALAKIRLNRPEPVSNLAGSPGDPLSGLSPFERAAYKHKVPANLLRAIGEAGQITDDPDIQARFYDGVATSLAGPLGQGMAPDQAVNAIFQGKVPAEFGPAVLERAYQIADDEDARAMAEATQGAQASEGSTTPAGDLARQGGASLMQGGGAVLRGIGEFNRLTRKPLDWVFGQDNSNDLKPVADAISGYAGSIREGVSEEGKKAVLGSTPKGNFFKPSTWEWGDDPSLRGYAMLTVDVLGSFAPVVAASIAGGPVAGAAVGGAQGGGAGAEQARGIVEELAGTTLEDGRSALEVESAYYREARASGMNHEEAVEATAKAAEQMAFVMTAPISTLGGGLTGKIVNPGTAITASKGIGTRVAARAGLGAVEEGTQEVAESVATATGANIGAGMDQPVAEATFGDFVLGALGGGPVGGVAGAFSKRTGETEEEPLPAPTPEPTTKEQVETAPGPLESAVSQGPMPLASDMTPSTPLVIRTADAGDFDVILVGEHPDGLRVRDDEGSEMIIPRAEIESGEASIVPSPERAPIEPETSAEPDLPGLSREATPPPQSRPPRTPETIWEPETLEEAQMRLEYLAERGHVNGWTKSLIMERDRIKAIVKEMLPAQEPTVEVTPEPEPELIEPMPEQAEPEVAAEAEPEIEIITKKDGTPFKQEAQVKRALRSRGLNLDEFSIEAADEGGLVARRVPAAEAEPEIEIITKKDGTPFKQEAQVKRALRSRGLNLDEFSIEAADEGGLVARRVPAAEPEPEIEIITKKDGTPFKQEAQVKRALRSRGLNLDEFSIEAADEGGLVARRVPAAEPEPEIEIITKKDGTPFKQEAQVKRALRSRGLNLDEFSIEAADEGGLVARRVPAAEPEPEIEIITKKDGTPFKQEAQVKRALRSRGLNLDEFSIEAADEGGLVARRVPAAEAEPEIEIITKKDGTPFKQEAQVKRALRSRGLNLDEFSIEAADEGGLVARRVPAAEPEPEIEIITKKDGTPFKQEAQVKRALRSRGLNLDEFSIEAADEGGLVARRVPAAEPEPEIEIITKKDGTPFKQEAQVKRALRSRGLNLDEFSIEAADEGGLVARRVPAAEPEPEIEIITKKDGTPFKQEAQVKRALRSRGLNLDEFSIEAADEGGLVARRIPAAEATEEQQAADPVEAPEPSQEEVVSEEGPTEAPKVESEAETPPTAEVVAEAAAEAEPNPTDAQKEAENYKKGHIKLHGLDVSIENAKGSERSGKAPDGTEWSVKMPAHYGYIKRTEGADGDHVDVYIGENPESDFVLVVNQMDPETKEFDEHKVVLGATDAGQAMDVYHGGFSDGSGPDRAGSTTEMDMEQFKAWLKDGDTTKPTEGVEETAKEEAAEPGQKPKPKPEPEPEEKPKPQKAEEPTFSYSVAPRKGQGFTSSRAMGAHLKSGAHGPFVTRLMDQGLIKVHETSKAFPGKKHPARAQAMTDDKGVIHLSAEYLSPETAEGVLLHEMFHAGVEPLIGSKAWTSLMNRVQGIYAAAARREASAQGHSSPWWEKAMERAGGLGPEEFAAYAIEHQRGAPNGVKEWVQRLLGQIKAFVLRRFGKQIGPVTPEQLRALAVAALRANITAPRAGEQRYSKPPNIVVQFLSALAANDEMFQNPRATGINLKRIFRQIDPTIKFVGDMANPEEHKGSGAEEKYLLRTANDEDFFVFQNEDEVWIDVSALKTGHGGSRIYAAVADYALNTRRVFKGDPAGLSDEALRRRTENMLSSAIKHGTTDHLAPHPRQIEGDASLGVPPLRWNDGDHDGNILELIKVSTESLAHHVPEFKRASYDFKTGTFRSGKGEPLTDGTLRKWSNSHPRIRAAGAGSTTLKRGILLNTLAREKSRILPGLLEFALRQQHQLVKPPRDVFYSKAPKYSIAPAIPESKFDEAERTFIGKALSQQLTQRMTGKYSLLWLAPGRGVFAELARRMPSAQEYLRMKQEMDATRAEWHHKTDDVAQAWRKLGVKGDANKRMMDIMHEATIAGVDPAETFKPLGTDEDTTRAAAYSDLRKRFRRLPEEHRKMYRTVRDSYKSLNEEFERVMLRNIEKAMDIGISRAERAHAAEMERIQDEGLTGGAKQDAIDTADRKFAAAKRRHTWGSKARLADLRLQFESQTIEAPYFPLARFGQYFVTVRDAETGKVVEFSRFETNKEQEEFFEAERAKPNQKVEKGVIGDGKIKEMVDPGFVTDVENILADSGVDEGVMDQVWQRWLETMPDLSLRKSRIHRKKTPGYSNDAFRAFGHHMFHGAHQLARLRWSMEMNEALDLAEEQARQSKDPVRSSLVIGEMRRRHDFTMNPTGSPAAQAITSGMFIWSLGVTPAAAIVNLTQTSIVGVPVLATLHDSASKGMGIAAKQLVRALGDFTKGKGKALNSKRLTNDEKAALTEAYRRSTIDATQSHDLAGVSETGVEYNSFRTKWMAKVAWFFHHGERLNREVTFLAAYRMARDKGMDHMFAVDKASDLTWRAHFDYQGNSRPRFMQNDISKVLFVFRNFQVNMLWRLFRDSHQALNGATEAERKEAITQLAGITGMLTLHAGITGVWGYSLAMTLAAALLPGDEDDIETAMKTGLVDALGANLAGMILYGTPGHVTGTALTNRIGMPDLWFRSPDRQLEGEDAYNYWVSEVLGAFPGAIQRAWRGFNMVTDGHWYRGIETAAPKFIKDLMRGLRFMNEGAATLSGDPLLDNMSPADILRQWIGFTPASLAERYDTNTKMKNKEQKIEDERQAITRAFVKAALAGKQPSEKVLDDIAGFNAENPDWPLKQKDLRKSAKEKARDAARGTFGLNLGTKIAPRILDESAPTIYSK